MTGSRRQGSLRRAGRETFGGGYGNRLERLDLSGQDLTSVSVDRLAWLDACDLSRADLRQADLAGSHWRFCDLRGADLRGASLRRASLAGCDLRDADLRGADLTGVRFGAVNTGDRTGRTVLTGALLDHGALDLAEIGAGVDLPVGMTTPGSLLDLAFPSSVRPTSRAVTTWFDDQPELPPMGSVGRPHQDLLVAGEVVLVPYRIYHDERRRRVEALDGSQRLVAACLLTRHHDGRVRQRWLPEVLGSDEPWTAPFVVELLGEYVLEIAEDLAAFARDELPSRPVLAGHLRAFLAANPAFDELTEHRVTSYWSCYFRPRFGRYDYPARAALDLIRG